MKSRFQGDQSRLQSFSGKPVASVDHSSLSSLLSQESANSNFLTTQGNTTSQQIATAKTKLTTDQKTFANLQEKLAEQHQKVAKIKNLLSDFSAPGANSDSDKDDWADILGKLTNLNFEE